MNCGIKINSEFMILLNCMFLAVKLPGAGIKFT